MKEQGKILVIGGGISGITTALEASEVGRDVILVEKSPTLGGRVSGFHQYFPKLCPPTCGLEINYRRLRANRHVQVYTNSEVLSVSGERSEEHTSELQSRTNLVCRLLLEKKKKKLYLIFQNIKFPHKFPQYDTGS